MNRSLPPTSADEATALVAEVAELLDVVWQRSRDTSPAPLSASQVRALLVLDATEGINLRDLARALGSTPPSVSRLCDRLHAVGFLDRTPSASSRRELDLRLSERGRTYLRDLRARREQDLAAVVGSLTPDARAALVEGLRQFRLAAASIPLSGEPPAQ